MSDADPLAVPPRTTARELVDEAWNFIEAGLVHVQQTDEPVDLDPAWQRLRALERLWPLEDPDHMLGRLILGHAPIFNAWGENRHVDREDIDAAHKNIVKTTLVNSAGEPLLTEITPQAADLGRAGIVSVLLSRRGNPKEEDVLYTVRPAAPQAMRPDFVDEQGLGYRHLQVLYPGTDHDIPIRVSDTGGASHKVNSHKEAGGVMVIGLGLMSRFLAKQILESDRYASTVGDQALRDAVTNDLVSILNRESFKPALMRPTDYRFLAAITNMLVKQVTSYHDTHF